MLRAAFLMLSISDWSCDIAYLLTFKAYSWCVIIFVWAGSKVGRVGDKADQNGSPGHMIDFGQYLWAF